MRTTFYSFHCVDGCTGLKLLQQPSGAFQATREKGECDMRFLYCACAISATLDDWTGDYRGLILHNVHESCNIFFNGCMFLLIGVDMIRAEAYILDCITYEGGLSLVPGANCAVFNSELQYRHNILTMVYVWTCMGVVNRQ